MLQLPLPHSDQDYLRGFSGIFYSPGEAQQYLYDSWERIQTVLIWLEQLAQSKVHRILELGANPYFLTLLIKKYLDFDLQLANYFGDSADNGTRTQSVQRNGKTYDFPYSHFNVEIDSFPYETGSFDCVIFCEILEHLILNPDFTLSEIKRVLRAEGFLILSTPNAARLGNFIKLLKGQNIYDGYSSHGIYGRHNREYTFDEVEALLRRHGFETVRSEVRNIYPHPLRSRLLQSLRPKVWHEHLFFLSRSVQK